MATPTDTKSVTPKRLCAEHQPAQGSSPRLESCTALLFAAGVVVVPCMPPPVLGCGPLGPPPVGPGEESGVPGVMSGKWVQAQAQAQEVTPLTKQHAQMLSWNSELPPHSQPTNTSCIRRWDELPQHPPHQTLSFFAMNIKHYKISKMNFIFQRISLLLEPNFCLWWNLQ